MKELDTQHQLEIGNDNFLMKSKELLRSFDLHESLIQHITTSQNNFEILKMRNKLVDFLDGLKNFKSESTQLNGDYQLSLNLLEKIKKEILSLQVQVLPTQVLPTQVFDTVLLSSEYYQQLCNWVGKTGWKLIYRASRDGFLAKTFHQLCDEKGETLVVIKSDAGWLFGGYTPLSWDSFANYVEDKSRLTFLFTLTNPHGIVPTKYILHNNKIMYAIRCIPTYGPTFGGGHDLYICDNANISVGSYINLSHTFKDTTGKGNTTFTGQYNGWEVADLEVFGL